MGIIYPLPPATSGCFRVSNRSAALFTTMSSVRCFFEQYMHSGSVI